MGPPVTTKRLRSRWLSESLLKEIISNQPTCLSMLKKSGGSVTSMIGMARVSLTCTTSWIFYAMGMNLTKKTCVKYGQTDDVEKKFCKFDEVVSLVQQAV